MPSDRDADGLGIVPPEQRRSVRYCVLRGTLLVNGPVFVLLMLGLGAILPVMVFVAGRLPDAPRGSVLDLLEFVFTVTLVSLSTVPAWLWWSVTVPKWRIWALEHVADWPALERAAVRAGLIWPRGWIFNRTEIKSMALREREAQLLKFRDQHG